jgi:hypothetical protein
MKDITPYYPKLFNEKPLNNINLNLIGLSNDGNYVLESTRPFFLIKRREVFSHYKKYKETFKISFDNSKKIKGKKSITLKNNKSSIAIFENTKPIPEVIYVAKLQKYNPFT